MEGVLEMIEAEQVTFVPPLEPAHVQVQVPEVQIGVDGVPVEQRLAVGAEITAVLLAEPHWPFTDITGAGNTVIVAVAVKVMPEVIVE